MVQISCSEETRNIGAKMYLIWDPGNVGTGHILVPLGYVGWGGYGDEKLINNYYVIQSDSSSNQNGFTPVTGGSSFPIWGNTVTNTSAPGCQ